MLLLATLSLATSSGSASSTPGLTLAPNINDLPGASVLSDLTNGLGGWALMAAMAGVVIGAVMWAFGHYSQNYQQAYNGRKGVLVSGLAAILISGAPQIVDFLIRQGAKI